MFLRARPLHDIITQQKDIYVYIYVIATEPANSDTFFSLRKNVLFNFESFCCILKFLFIVYSIYKYIFIMAYARNMFSYKHTYVPPLSLSLSHSHSMYL